MKHIGLRLGIALLTFMVGVGVAWSYQRILQPTADGFGGYDCGWVVQK